MSTIAPAIFSQLLNVFQTYYHYPVVTHGNREFNRFHFLASFLRLLHDGGINEYEDPDRPFPRGHVQVMTIHQAKGLEFPVVVVGSLSTQLVSPKRIDRDLGSFYGRPPFEPESHIVTTPPEAAICRECGLRALCRAEGVIDEVGESEALAA